MSAGAERLVALDVFRGLTMAAMVIVNNGGDGEHVYAPLKHAPWHGWTPTDLIFPFFLFMVGLSITLSRKTGSWGAIARRTAVLFGIGLFLNGYPRFDIVHWRWLGVLQRIALCYGASASIVKLLGFERASTPDDRRALARSIAIIVAGLLLGYWAVMMLVPGAFGTPGDLTQPGNVAARIDRALLGLHSYRPTYDPEGLLSTLPAIGTTLIGVLAGLWLKSGASIARRSGGFVLGGVAFIAAGMLWDVWFPINKALWTSSYVLFTAGAASLTFGACLWLIDAKGYRGWTGPFVILGRNALALFVLSGLLAKTLSAIPLVTGEGPMSLRTWVYRYGFAPLAAPINASLLYAIANLAVLFVVLWGLHKKGIWLRV
jgi:predicted acyltransferase